MPWVKFTADHDFRMTRHAVRAYKAGMKCLVSQACAEEAIKAGKAVAINRDGSDDDGR